MPVDTPHVEYDEKAPLWAKVRDFVGGSEEVKNRGTIYLPDLEGAEPGAYAKYLARAMFYSASGRTVQGLSGAILRKPPVITYPDERKKELQSIGHRKETIEQLLKHAVDEVLSPGRIGFLVDAPAKTDGNPAPKPYIACYFAEDIVNWREVIIEDRRVLKMVVLREQEEHPNPKDRFEIETKTIYRVLGLGFTGDVRYENELKPYYYQQIWEEKKTKDPRTGLEKIEWVLRETIIPEMNGGRLLREIPFTFINPTSLTAAPEKPPLLDLINVNLSHYQNSADLEHGRHYTALPTPWAMGFDPSGTKLRIGSGTAWVSKEPGGSVGMLEFTGAGLKALSEGMKDKERLMAILGARLLEEQKASEAAVGVLARHGGEAANLSNISMVIGRAFTQILRWVYSWTIVTSNLDTILVTLNKDFNVAQMDAPMLEKLMAALQGGSISWETWIYNLQKGELLPEDVDAEKERQRVDKGLPAGMGTVIQEITKASTPPPAPKPPGGSA